MTPFIIRNSLKTALVILLGLLALFTLYLETWMHRLRQ